MVAAPNAGAGTPWRLKLEAADPNVNLEVGLADSVEGVEPTVGAWQHYTFLSSVDKVLVFPTWEQANGAVIWLDKVRFLKPPAP
jgi:hypothetical protein